MQKIGILAIQGSFAEHAKCLELMEQEFVYIKKKEDLENVTHLIIPGGESTTLKKLLQKYEIWAVLKKKVNTGKINILGTCAGAILISDWLEEKFFSVIRNAYGSQQASFVSVLESEVFPNLEGVFIRAPKLKIRASKNENFEKIKILTTHKKDPVMIEGGNFLALSFHPEINQSLEIYEYWLK